MIGTAIIFGFLLLGFILNPKADMTSISSTVIFIIVCTFIVDMLLFFKNMTK